MSMVLSELRLAIELPMVVPSAANYRPTSWPPQRNWPVILDADGNVVSRWGDPIWRLDPWAGMPVTLNFGDGPVRKNAAPIDPENADILRIVTGWWLYGQYAARGFRGLKTRFDQMRRLVVLCTQEGILATRLSKFPQVSDQLPRFIQVSRSGEFLGLLHELYERRDMLGFTILDRGGLTRLAAGLPSHQTKQTPYIPPRIWRYQVTRIRECLDDFLTHQKGVEDCFRFCMSAYQENYKSIKGEIKSGSVRPFQWPSDGSNGKITGALYFGPFVDIAKRFGIDALLKRWLKLEERKIHFSSLTRYLNNMSRVGLAYLLNFSLMRVEEAWNLRSDCLQIEQDARFGDIYVLRGRTTKTTTDHDALWVTSPSTEIALRVMRSVAHLRDESPSSELEIGTKANRLSGSYLIDQSLRPRRINSNKALRPSIPSYARVAELMSNLFDPDQLRILPEDLRLARLVTPTLSAEFAVGSIWPLAWHQLRRTGAVNMQASGLVSDASLQFQLKHVTRAMSLYYGQNHARVRLEEKAHTIYVRTMYETLGQQLHKLAGERFSSPHGEKRKSEIVRLMSSKDTKKVTELAKKGVVAQRPIILGVCTSRTPCPYGGIDNIAHCGGGDSVGGPKPCADVLYDANKMEEVETLSTVLNERLAIAEVNSPLRASLEAQKRSLENYRHVIKHQKSR